MEHNNISITSILAFGISLFCLGMTVDTWITDHKIEKYKHKIEVLEKTLQENGIYIS
jgi:hypothetical protein